MRGSVCLDKAMRDIAKHGATWSRTQLAKVPRTPKTICLRSPQGGHAPLATLGQLVSAVHKTELCVTLSAFARHEGNRAAHASVALTLGVDLGSVRGRRL